MADRPLMDKPTIFFDMDGVLADFDKHAEEVLGTDNIYKYEFVYGSNAFWKGLNSDPEFFKHLTMMPGALRLLRATQFYPRAILTALPKNPRRVDVDAQKRAWVEDNLVGYFPVHTCDTTDKPNYCKPGDILIDDRAVNKTAWEAKGGRFIIHTDVENTLAQLKSMGVS